MIRIVVLSAPPTVTNIFQIAIMVIGLDKL